MYLDNIMMEHFNHVENCNVTYVPVQNIAISKPIIAAIKNAGGNNN